MRYRETLYTGHGDDVDDRNGMVESIVQVPSSFSTLKFMSVSVTAFAFSSTAMQAFFHYDSFSLIC